MRQIIDKPSPITGGLLELCTEPATVKFRGETISYERSFYHCVDSGMEFVDDDLGNSNLKLVYDKYRRSHGIPLVEEIKSMRERYGIPASAMSIILGLGENQYGLYEEGAMPTPSVGRLLLMARNPGVMIEMLQLARSSFSEKQYRKYYDAIVFAMPPARYSIEGAGLLEYGGFPSFPPSVILTSQSAVSSQKKTPYNKYIYARAY
ncbi:MAG: hypothetical protein J5382_03770 [Bacteroidales bacterium]|nr:hypothetical protein [Bacteroidales bacterium]